MKFAFLSPCGSGDRGAFRLAFWRRRRDCLEVPRQCAERVCRKLLVRHHRLQTPRLDLCDCLTLLGMRDGRSKCLARSRGIRGALGVPRGPGPGRRADGPGDVSERVGEPAELAQRRPHRQ